MRSKSFSRVFVLLLVTVLLTGCVGSSSLVDKATTGSIVFHLTKGEEQPISALSTSPEPTHIRVRISHANGYRVIRDIPVPQSEAVEITVPATTGYRIDAVSYMKNWEKYNSVSDYNLLLKHDTKLGINVNPGSTTMVQLILEPFAPTVSLPTEVIANESFPITISNVPDVLSRQVYFKIDTDPFTSNSAMVSLGSSLPLRDLSNLKRSGTNNINAPDSNSEGFMYFNSFFYLDDTMAFAEEHNWLFALWVNNINLGEPQISVPLKLPEGGIGIGIVY